MRVILLWAVTSTDPPNWKMATGYLQTGYLEEPSVWVWDGRKLMAYDTQPTHWMPLPAPPAGGMSPAGRQHDAPS